MNVAGQPRLGTHFFPRLAKWGLGCMQSTCTIGTVCIILQVVQSVFGTCQYILVKNWLLSISYEFGLAWLSTRGPGTYTHHRRSWGARLIVCSCDESEFSTCSCEARLLYEQIVRNDCIYCFRPNLPISASTGIRLPDAVQECGV